MSEKIKLKSIWDGWEKHVKYHFRDAWGASCANGYIHNYDYINVPLSRVKTLKRVATYIRANYPVPASLAEKGWPSNDSLCIAHANNEIPLMPEDFRRIDKCTQLEALRASLTAQEE